MPEAVGDVIGRAAFRRLLRTGRAVPIQELASDLDRPLGEVEAQVMASSTQGRMRLDAEGRVIGAAGLSVEPDRHRVEIAGRSFWTWCAWDLLGICGALRADGVSRSISPWSGTPLEVRFRHGRPEPSPLVVFRPDDGYRERCQDLYREWCSNSNLFEGREAAEAWSEREGMQGRILGLEEAANSAAQTWQPLAEGPP
ncbi:MAG TPA: organomercurial lyase [Candidatus Dormibacteraeota bacterium]|nr:organomercurial lyase [Candidatus Dormibacteraeota bacterium]